MTGKPQSKEAGDGAGFKTGLCGSITETISQCTLSKPRIWIQVTIIYLGFTLMEYSCLEPLETFVQITQTSRSCFLVLRLISTWPGPGSGSHFSENMHCCTVSNVATVPPGFSDVATVPPGLGDAATLSLQGSVTQPHCPLQGLVMQPLVLTGLNEIATVPTVLWDGRQQDLQQLLDFKLPLLCGISSYTFLES